MLRAHRGQGAILSVWLTLVVARASVTLAESCPRYFSTAASAPEGAAASNATPARARAAS